MSTRYKKGDTVEAKWPGSSIYNPAEVVEGGVKECRVLFEDGSVFKVKTSSLKPHVEKPKRGRPTKAESRSRSRSGGRKSAPMATRSRSRSPSRTSTKNEPERPTRHMKVRKSTNSLLPEKPKNEVEAIARKVLEEEMKAAKVSLSNCLHEKASETITIKNTVQQRSSARIAALQTTRSSTRTPDPSDKVKKAAKKAYSDDEEEEEAPKPKEFSYVSFLAVVFKIVLLPLSILYFCLACNKGCSGFKIPRYYMKWQDFQKEVKYPLPFCAAFHLALFLFAKLPIGKEVKGFPFGEKGIVRKYRLNGFYALLVAISIFTALVYFEFNMNWGYDRINGIMISSLIYSATWSLIIHCYGLFKKKDMAQMKKNPKSGFLGNFYYGHEINPLFYFGDDLKTRFIQFGLIGLVLIDASIFCSFITRGLSFTPLTLALLMHAFFVIDFFWREETMLSTATYTEDGVGYGFVMSIGSVIPMAFAQQSFYLIQNLHKASHFPYYCSASILALYIAGCYLYMTSMNLKHMFRRNPYDPALSHIKTIPTSRKKRLMISGIWGKIRHPNYLGLLIMAAACTLPSGFSNVLPHFPFLLIVLMVIIRIFTVESQCKDKYGPAWQNYVDAVPNRIIPYII